MMGSKAQQDLQIVDIDEDKNYLVGGKKKSCDNELIYLDGKDPNKFSKQQVIKP